MKETDGAYKKINKKGTCIWWREQRAECINEDLGRQRQISCYWKRKSRRDPVSDTCPGAVASAASGAGWKRKIYFFNLSAPCSATPRRSSADISTINKSYLRRTNTSYWSKRSHFNLVDSDEAHCVVVHLIQLIFYFSLPPLFLFVTLLSFLSFYFYPYVPFIYIFFVFISVSTFHKNMRWIVNAPR